MTCTYRTGVASSPAGAKAMAIYVSTEMLQPERTELARYYAGEFVPEPPRELIPTEQLGRELNEGAISFSEALDLLVQAEIATNRGRNFDFDTAEDRLAKELLDAAARADFESEVKAGRGTIGQVRPDLSPQRPFPTHPLVCFWPGRPPGQGPTAGDIHDRLGVRSRPVRDPLHGWRNVKPCAPPVRFGPHRDYGCTRERRTRPRRSIATE
jgi:hypothetical protein